MSSWSTSSNVNANGDEKNGDETKVDDGVDENRDGAGLHVDELSHSVFPRQLKQNSWAQNNEQNYSYQNRPPIRHFQPIWALIFDLWS